RVIIVCVRDIGVGDWNPLLLHLGNVAQRVGRQGSIEAGEAWLPEWVGDGLAVHVVHGRTAIVNRRIDVLGAEQAEVAAVTAWFVGKLVGPRICQVPRSEERRVGKEFRTEYLLE